MARRRPIYENNAAERFRRIIRPSLQGNVARVEPIMANRMAMDLFDFLRDTIMDAVRLSPLDDEGQEIKRQLLTGIRVIGRNSLRTLEGRIDSYPWIFPHEYGGDISSDEGKLLTIPIFYGLRPDGTPKFKNATSWKRFGSFVYTQKATGTKFIAYKSKSRELRILYVLKEEVNIPARLGLNRMAASKLGGLMASWWIIYTQEMFRAGIINPFERQD